MDRPYYSQRAGKLPASEPLELNDLKGVFVGLFRWFEDEGYFQESLGYHCVDRGFVPGSVGTDIETELLLTLRKKHLWPVDSTIDNWSEDDFFDMVEFLHDHVSKPTKRHFHDFSDCGWHCSEFDREPGRAEYRQKLNRLLRAYDSGFELSGAGEVLSLADSGLDPLLEATVPHDDVDNIGARVDKAITKFRRRRSSYEDRRDAVRDLADVLEFLRPQLKQVLTSKDESDLFNIANNFGIRHHNSDQKVEYNGAVWLSWIFYYYLATIHATVRLIEKADAK